MLQSIKQPHFRATILPVVDGFSKKSHSVVKKFCDGVKLLATKIGELGGVPVPEELTRGLCVGLCVGTLGADVCAMVVANSSRQHLDTTSKEKPVDPWLGIWQCATTMSVVCALLLGAAMYHSDTPGDPMMGRYKRIVTHMGIFSLIGSWFCLLVGVGVWSYYPWILMLLVLSVGGCRIMVVLPVDPPARDDGLWCLSLGLECRILHQSTLREAPVQGRPGVADSRTATWYSDYSSV